MQAFSYVIEFPLRQDGESTYSFQKLWTTFLSTNVLVYMTSIHSLSLPQFSTITYISKFPAQGKFYFENLEFMLYVLWIRNKIFLKKIALGRNLNSSLLIITSIDDVYRGDT